MADKSEMKIEIGFTGGGSVHITADSAQWEQLETALNGDGGWVTISGKDEASYMLSTDKVVYVRTNALTRAIGFRE
jgi:hypothetical protein